MENINTERLSEEEIDQTLGLPILEDEEDLDEEAEAELPLQGLTTARVLNDSHILRSSVTVKAATEKVYIS